MDFRIETDNLGEVRVPSKHLWGAQTQRAIEHFNIGNELFPKEFIFAYAILKKASAIVNHQNGGLDEQQKDLIIKVCNEILSGKHLAEFPSHIWMSGSGTQFNMNINEVISNRCCQLTGNPLGIKKPVHPNDHVNMSQSSNDSFPTAICIAVAMGIKQDLLPAVKKLSDAIADKAHRWKDIIKMGRTHMQDAVPLTLGQEFSGYSEMLNDNLDRFEQSLQGVYKLSLGGTAVGTGINAFSGFDEEVAKEIAIITELPFVTAPNKFAVQGSHDALVQMSSTLKTLATSLYKIANDIRILSSGPRCGFAELRIPENEPGSSIMPGKVNPTQCEALTMLSIQVIANDLAVTFGGGGGCLEMNVYKPLIMFNLMNSIRLLTDGCSNFRTFLIEGIEPNQKQINYFVQRSLMLVTSLSPIIGYDKASQIVHYALDNDLTLRESALKLGFVCADDFDSIVKIDKMIGN